jgi:fatty acid desaturase
MSYIRRTVHPVTRRQRYIEMRNRDPKYIRASEASRKLVTYAMLVAASISLMAGALYWSFVILLAVGLFNVCEAFRARKR